MQAQYTQSDTIAGMISKANTFMQSAIGVSDSYTERPPILYTASGSRIVGQLGPHCSTTLVRVISTSSLQNQLLPVISGDVHALECDPLQPARYFYHADHLGSATWITDSVGNPAQFLQYLPYGEIWRNQQRRGYDERYKYSGKERDVETGYDYFGARHYTSAISGWLSPDPLMDKYPNISPYAYCNWNPLKYVDPDGTNSQLTINGNTITISAKYYSLPKDYNSVLRATAFWNNQKDLKYTAPDGKVYSVRFELKAYQSNNPKNEILSGTISKNTYGVVRSLGKDANGNLRTGVTINNQHIKVIEARESGTTGAHEVGHSLMDTHNQDYEHTESGIMTPHVNDNNRSKRVTQETVNTIVESNGFNSKNQSLWSRIKSFFE